MPLWRRPSARWVYPYVLTLTLFVGMAQSQLPSLVLDIVCMAHPPSALSASAFDMPAARRSFKDHPRSAPPRSDLHSWLDASFGTLSSYYPSIRDEPAQASLINAREVSQQQATVLPFRTPWGEIDPSACRKDVGVQRLTAKVNLWSNAIGNLLNVATTAYWSDKSDRVGRKPVLMVAQMAFLACDGMFLLSAIKPQLVSTFGVGVLVVGPTLLAMLGGGPVSGRVCQAYLADTTTGSLAAKFSLLLGFSAIGNTLGPILATYLVRRFHDRISVVVSMGLMILLLVVLPESLSKSVKENNIRKFQERRKGVREAQEALSLRLEEQVTSDPRLVILWRRSVRVIHQRLSWCISILEPIGVFWPHRDSALSSGQRDYNLLLLAVGLFLVGSVRGDGASTLQYTMYVFGWDQTQIAPYLSMRAFGQVAVLMGLVPLVTHLCRPPGADPVSPPSDIDNGFQWQTETAPLLSQDRPPQLLYAGASSASGDETPGQPLGIHSEADSHPDVDADSRFDRRTLLMCLFAELVANVVLGSNATGNATVFVVITGICFSLGAPADSSWSTLMIRLAKGAQPGRVLGAEGVITALSKLIGNVLFALLWSATLTTYTPTIFLVASALYIAAVIAISRLRV